MSSGPDVTILGAGLAGLAAARMLVDAGLEVELVEGRERVGGRAWTIHPEHDLPAELGPEYVHGEPEVTLQLLAEAHLGREPVRDVHHTVRDGLLVEEPGVWRRFGELISQAPAATRDMSARDFLARQRIPDHDRRLFENLIQGYYGAPLSEISIASISADDSGATGSEDSAMSRVRGGYGSLAHWLLSYVVRHGARIRYGHVVRAIDWSTHRVRVDYQVGDVLSSLVTPRVIITFPLGVLTLTGEDAIKFHPQLGAHTRAMMQLGMGQVVKVVACMREPLWHEFTDRHLEFIHAIPGAAFPTFWLRSSGDAHQLTAWAGGPQTQVFEEMSSVEIVEQALDDFCATLRIPPARLEGDVDHWHYHDFAHDPFTRGAYSYTKVGGSTAAATLATPLGDVLYFAGEATDADYEGSVAGALRSGQRAAHQILERMVRRHAA